jgi:phosphoserine phosphatase
MTTTPQNFWLNKSDSELLDLIAEGIATGNQAAALRYALRQVHADAAKKTANLTRPLKREHEFDGEEWSKQFRMSEDDIARVKAVAKALGDEDNASAAVRFVIRRISKQWQSKQAAT